MKLNSQVKSISTLKAKAAELIQQISTDGNPIVITQNGEATAVLQDLATYERTQETLALLKILSLSERQVAEGKTVPLDEAVKSIRASLRNG